MRNYIIGFALLFVAFYLMVQQEPYPQDLPRMDTNHSKEDSPRPTQAVYNDSSVEASPSVPQETFQASTSASEEIIVNGLSNQFSRLQFSNETGGIRNITLHQHNRLNKEFSLIQEGTPFLGLSFEDTNGNPLKSKIPDPRAFKKVNGADPQKIVYQWKSKQNLLIERTYWRDSQDSYLFRHQTKFSNLGDQPLNLERMRLHLGSAFQIPRMYNPFDNASTYLNVGYYNAGPAIPEGCSCATCSGRIDGEADEFIQLNEMGPSGNMEVRYLSQARWACVNNQFFVNLVRPVGDMASVRIYGNSVQKAEDHNGTEIMGIEGAMSFPVGLLEPGDSKSYEFDIYSGPKDYMGLKSLGGEQKKVMQFGIFWWISEPLSWALNYLSNLFGSYGFGIIGLTIIVKLLLWPLTAQATRSQKKMQELQGPMGKLREKHKGNSQKLNQEMMKFYKEHKVNPFAGCWPILIQIPIFLGMFWMLRSAAELYGQNFLWANDLSEQDNVSTIQGFSLNVLPIFMVATQWFQMRLNPMQMGPQMSEAQRINAKMMRFMPFMFLVFLYFFSSALVLYWTIQNLMTILQTLITKTNTKNLETENASTKGKSLEEKEPQARLAISDEERRYRNLLGLKSKGSVNLKKLEENFKIRMVNYEDEKLSKMSASKRRTSLEKKERLQEAYDYLKESADKQS